MAEVAKANCCLASSRGGHKRSVVKWDLDVTVSSVSGPLSFTGNSSMLEAFSSLLFSRYGSLGRDRFRRTWTSCGLGARKNVEDNDGYRLSLMYTSLTLAFDLGTRTGVSADVEREAVKALMDIIVLDSIGTLFLIIATNWTTNAIIVLKDEYSCFRDVRYFTASSVKLNADGFLYQEKGNKADSLSVAVPVRNVLQYSWGTLKADLDLKNSIFAPGGMAMTRAMTLKKWDKRRFPFRSSRSNKFLEFTFRNKVASWFGSCNVLMGPDSFLATVEVEEVELLAGCKELCGCDLVLVEGHFPRWLTGAAKLMVSGARGKEEEGDAKGVGAEEVELESDDGEEDAEDEDEEDEEEEEEDDDDDVEADDIGEEEDGEEDEDDGEGEEEDEDEEDGDDEEEDEEEDDAESEEDVEPPKKKRK